MEREETTLTGEQPVSKKRSNWYLVAFCLPFLVYGEVIARTIAPRFAPYNATDQGWAVAVGSLLGSLVGAAFAYALYKGIDSIFHNKGTRITIKWVSVIVGFFIYCLVLGSIS